MNKGSPMVSATHRLHRISAVTWVRTLHFWALISTIPAFYVELLSEQPSVLAKMSYLAAALTLGLSAWLARQQHDRQRSQRGADATHALAHPVLLPLLMAGLVAAAALPPSSTSSLGLIVRSGTALLTLVEFVWSLQRWLERGSLPVLLALAVTILALCGVGFWWLEPRTPTLADGLWLAFTTAATVGYGDVVPSTPASKIFAVFVVLLGFGVLSLVTASIAAMWVESRERDIESEILQDLHRQVGLLREEVRSLRRTADAITGSTGQPAFSRQGQQPLEDQGVDHLEGQFGGAGDLGRGTAGHVQGRRRG